MDNSAKPIKKDVAHFAQASICADSPTNHLSRFGSHCLAHQANIATYKIRISDKGIRVFWYGEPVAHEVSRGVLATLHLTVHNPRIMSFSINVMHLSLFTRGQPLESPQLRLLHLCHESGLNESDT